MTITDSLTICSKNLGKKPIKENSPIFSHLGEHQEINYPLGCKNFSPQHLSTVLSSAINIMGYFIFWKSLDE